jgi:hypothetical protein
MDLALGILNGFPNRFVWDIKRSGESANECIASSKVSLAEVFEPPKTLGYVFVSAATDQLHRSQAKFFATTGNESRDGKFVRHEKSSVRLN